MKKVITLLVIFILTRVMADDISDAGRPLLNRIRITEGSKSKSEILIIDEKAWDINRCLQRAKSNPNDGDARFVVGCNNILQEEYEKAASQFGNAERVRYNKFGLNDMLEGLGCSYYGMQKDAKKWKKTEEFLNFLLKERQVYYSSLTDKTMAQNKFRYIYALTFIDLGLYLEVMAQKGKTSRVTLPDLNRSFDSQQAFEKAADELSELKAEDYTIIEKQLFVYKRLGRSDKVRVLQNLQLTLRKNEMLEEQRKPIEDKIIASLYERKYLTSDFKRKFVQILSVKYSGDNKKAKEELGDLKAGLINDIIRNAPEGHALSDENKAILGKKIEKEINKVIIDTLAFWEADYLWDRIKNKASIDRDFEDALKQISIHKKFLNKYINPKEIENYQALLISENEKQKEAEAETLKKSMLKPKPAAKQEPKPSSNAVIKQDSVKTKVVKTESEPSEHERVSKLIDDLIGKRDYVAAYRGVKAYESLLKSNYGQDEIDIIIRDLETAIFQKHGETFLNKLKDEMEK